MSSLPQSLADSTPPASEPRLPQILRDWQEGRPVSVDALGRFALATWKTLCLRVAEDEAVAEEHERVWRVALADRAEVTRERETLQSRFAAVRDLGAFLLQVADERGAA